MAYGKSIPAEKQALMIVIQPTDVTTAFYHGVSL